MEQGETGSVLDGDGSKWWDGQGTNGGKTKPKFFYAHSLTSSTISGITLKNTPVQGFSIDGAKGLTLSDITIDNKDGDATDSSGDALGHNTDAFDVGDSSDVTISGATIYNQDDCLAINSGTGITFTGGYCSGGHGLSIGSVGGRSDNTVENVVIENSQVVNSMNVSFTRIPQHDLSNPIVAGYPYQDCLWCYWQRQEHHVLWHHRLRYYRLRHRHW